MNKYLICEKDNNILRNLAISVAEIAQLPVHGQTKGLWKQLNGLKETRPLLYVDELPWHEIDVNGELTVLTDSPFCQWIETELRRTLYRWRHIPCDMVVEPVIYTPLSIHDTGLGVDQQVKIISQHEKGGVNSQAFTPQFLTDKDLNKIKLPQITHDEADSEEKFQAVKSAIGDILTVKKFGIGFEWFSPWDYLITVYGVEQAMADLVLKPDYVHAVMERLMLGYFSRLNQWEDLNLLSADTYNYRVGSGGLGYTDELPAEGFNPEKVRTCDLWGNGVSQIFSSVSPEMHEEFSLQYERPWLERFGLAYYGCCEPLHHKIHILRNIPNLRKISISPFADMAVSAEAIGTDYVISHKPNPAILAESSWDLPQARKELRRSLDKARGCHVEVILKDVSTVCDEPRRLWEWCDMAMEEVNIYKGVTA